MSSPRAATSVATSTEQLRLAKRTSTWSRSRCSSSPCSASALKPCACSSTDQRRGTAPWCCRRPSVLAGPEVVEQQATACSRSLSFDLVPALLDLRLLACCASTFTVIGSRMNCAGQLGDAFRVGGGEQQRLPRLAGTAAPPSTMSSKKPMSSMRSASSSTSVFSASSFRLPRSRWSSTRPGVPTTMCAPCSSVAVCPRSGTPPHRVTTLMLSSARARRRISGGDLVGQFARRAQHQRLHGEAPRVQVGQQRQREGGGLAAAGLGLRDQVLAQQRGGRLAAWIGVISR